MKTILLLSSCSLLATLSSCMPTPYQPTAQELKTADYGAYPSNYKQLIKRHFQSRLKNPETARYRFGRKPFKMNSFAYSKEDVRYYYQVPVAVNGMNSYGHYVGERLYAFNIKNGKIIGTINATGTRNPERILYGSQ